MDCKITGVCWLMLYPATMHDITVDLSPVENPSRTRCGLARGTANPGEMKYFTCEAESEGRFVAVTSSGVKQMLSINEVQVYGEEGGLIICICCPWECSHNTALDITGDSM